MLAVIGWGAIVALAIAVVVMIGLFFMVLGRARRSSR
jgi:hypothetical protein